MTHLKTFHGIENENFFTQDSGLQTLLRDLLREQKTDEVFSSLAECGELVAGRWNELTNQANRAEHAPRIIKFDRTGERVEKIDFGLPVDRLRREVAEFGVLTKVKNQVHKFAFVYLLAHNGESSLTCPISCTDGLVAAMEAKGSNQLKEAYLEKILLSDTPFAGAQFVTEHDAGSDVGAITTTAEPITVINGHEEGSRWTITGDKWFCSNPDEFFAVVARVDSPNAYGTDGIGLFFVPRVLPDGSLNNLSILRLKDKLGTRALPTAEIKFDNAIGFPIGPTDEGFKTLMNYVLNVSRIHNAVNACGFLHRAFLEARNYARQRKAFGREIVNYSLVQETLLKLLARLWRQRLLVFKLISLIDANGLVPETEEQAMWQRFLTNLAKYRTAVKLTDSIKEAILLFGGNGIVEDFTVLPRLLRDAMIIETWEGAHNTLCLQIMRDMKRSRLLEHFMSEINRVLESWPELMLPTARSRFVVALDHLKETVTSERLADDSWTLRHARRVVDRLGDLLEIAWMAEFAAQHEGEDSTAALLTVVASDELNSSQSETLSPVIEKLEKYVAALIDEEIVKADLGQI
jgi:alkylation response protein AidB-like acyl-CoA dehydrogenase